MGYLQYDWIIANLRGNEEIWGYFGGSTTKIPPYLPLTPAISREPYDSLQFSGDIWYHDIEITP